MRKERHENVSKPGAALSDSYLEIGRPTPKTAYRVARGRSSSRNAIHPTAYPDRVSAYIVDIPVHRGRVANFMKVSLDWLRRYVPIQIGGTALAELLTAKALSVDTVEQVGDDWVLDIEVTSNRTDCLGHMGVARQIAAIIQALFTEPEFELSEGGAPRSALICASD